MLYQIVIQTTKYTRHFQAPTRADADAIVVRECNFWLNENKGAGWGFNSMVTCG